MTLTTTVSSSASSWSKAAHAGSPMMRFVPECSRQSAQTQHSMLSVPSLPGRVGRKGKALSVLRYGGCEYDSPSRSKQGSAPSLISFSGSPLKGFQILGLLESRSLSFDNVIIMDVNETLLPKLKINEPLIPREIISWNKTKTTACSACKHYTYTFFIELFKWFT